MCAHNIAQSHSRAQCPPIPISDGFFPVRDGIFFARWIGDTWQLVIWMVSCGLILRTFTWYVAQHFFASYAYLYYIYIHVWFYISIYLSIYLSVGININVCNLFLASADVGSISKQISCHHNSTCVRCVLAAKWNQCHTDRRCLRLCWVVVTKWVKNDLCMIWVF